MATIRRAIQADINPSSLLIRSAASKALSNHEASIVDEDVQCTELPHGQLYHFVNSPAVGNAAANGYRATAVVLYVSRYQFRCDVGTMLVRDDTRPLRVPWRSPYRSREPHQ